MNRECGPLANNASDEHGIDVRDVVGRQDDPAGRRDAVEMAKPNPEHQAVEWVPSSSYSRDVGRDSPLE
jgi:hypothetical protein